MTDGAERAWLGSMAEIYDRCLVPAVFAPFAEDLARRVGELHPTTVVELAAGTGALTRQLVRGTAEHGVTATDLNDAMVEWGGQRVPEASWRRADAAALPFADGGTDVVACQFGVMFFPDKVAAFDEIRRVLRSDGHLLFSVWAPLDTHVFAAALVAGLEQAFPDDPPRFVATVPHGYADEARIRTDLAAGGLTCTSCDEITVDGRAESAAELAVGFCTGTPLRAAITERGDLDRATDVVAATMEEILGSGPVVGSMTALVLSAVPAAAGGAAGAEQP